MDFAIQEIQEKDNTQLAQMIRAVFDEFNAPKTGTVYSDPTTDDLFNLFKTPNAILWVAKHQGKAIGCCGIYPTNGLDNNYGELVKFYLSANARGHGIGNALMSHCINSAKEMDYSHIYLESLPVFSRAITMYEKAGFTRLKQALGNSGHTSCNIWMLKTIV